MHHHGFYILHMCLTLQNLMQHWCFKDEEWVHVIQGLLCSRKRWRVSLPPWTVPLFCLYPLEIFSYARLAKIQNDELPTHMVYVIIDFHVLVCSCVKSFQKVKREHSVLRQKLEGYFQVTVSHKSHPLFPASASATCPSVCVCILCSCCDKPVLLELPPGLLCKSVALACYRLALKWSTAQEDCLGMHRFPAATTSWPCCSATRDQRIWNGTKQEEMLRNKKRWRFQKKRERGKKHRGKGRKEMRNLCK